MIRFEQQKSLQQKEPSGVNQHRWYEMNQNVILIARVVK